jgi:predicted ABC-type ATPase
MARWMWIFAGPNGAGKSSFAKPFLDGIAPPDMIRLNADERTVELRQRFPEAPEEKLNLEAAIAVDADVDACIAERKNFSVETVLSSDKYRRRVVDAKAAGMKVGLFYISLHPPELSPQRVSERAAKGGHNVDEVKAVDRYRRSHEQFRWFARRSDQLVVFDNSGEGKPVMVATRQQGGPLKYLRYGVNPAVEGALAAAFPSEIKGPSQDLAEPLS